MDVGLRTQIGLETSDSVLSIKMSGPHDDYLMCTVKWSERCTHPPQPTTQPVSQDKHKKPAQQSPNQTSPTCFCSYSVNWQPHHWQKLHINLSQVTQLQEFWCFDVCRFLDDIVTRPGPAMQAIKCVVVGDGAVGKMTGEDNCHNNLKSKRSIFLMWLTVTLNCLDILLTNNYFR